MESTTYADPCEDLGCAYDQENVCTRCGGQAACDECGTDAVEQDSFDGHLCQAHLDMAWESAEAERQHDMWKERGL